MSEKLKRAYETVGDLMERILAVFKPGAKITVIVRRPGQDDQDFLMTDDDLVEVVALIRRRQAENGSETA